MSGTTFDPDPILSVEDLHVTYGPIVAVRGVHLYSGAGQITAIIGTNGAGKSSVLNAIVGLVPASKGRIRFEGRDVTGRPPERIVKMGMTLTPEGRHVFASLTVRENLQLGAASVKDRATVAAAWEEVYELFPVLKTRESQLAGTLSGGEQQRLAIARSLMSRPRLLLLDEPSLGLAPQAVDRVFDLIVTLKERGLTILLVEQNVTQSLEIADRAYVLEGGRVRLEGTASDLRRSSEVAKAYLGV